MDNQFYKSAVNSLRNEIKSYVSQITAKLHFDITKSAVILSQSGNGYTILLDGNTYNNIPTDIKGAVFPINSVARIMIPQANYNNMFIMGLGEYTPNPTESEILMEQEAVATNTNYPVLLSPQTTNGARIGYFGTGVTVNPSTNTITANLNGTANKATNDINGNPIVTTYVKTTDIPTKVSQLTNDSGYITVSQAPVQSVNGKTGTVSLVTDDVPATATNRYVPAQPTTNSSNSFLNGDGNFVQIAVGGGSSSVANLFFSNTASAVGGYKILNYVADATATQASITCTSSADVLGYTYLYNDGIGTTTIDAGIWKSTFYGYVSNTQGETRLKIICFVYHTDGTTRDLFTKYTNDFDSTTAMSFYTETNRSQFSVLATDRLGFRVYGTTTRTSTTTIYFVMGGLNAAYINTPLALRHAQLRDLNGLADYQHMTSAQQTKLNNLGKTLTIVQNGTTVGTYNGSSDVSISLTNNTYTNGTVLALNSDVFSLNASLDNLNDVSISTPTNTQLLSYNGTNWTNIDAPILTYTEITSSMTFNKNVITTGVEASHIWYNSTSKHVFGIIKTNDYITNNDTICTFPSPILSSSFSGACGIGISLNGTMDIASFESGSIKSTQNLLYPQNTLYASDGINPTGTTTSFGIAYNISFNY